MSSNRNRTPRGRLIRRIAAGGVATAAALTLAACTGSGGSGRIGNGNSNSAPTGHKQQGGTVTEAELPGSSPNFIFPLIPASNTNGWNVNLSQPLWPMLVALGDGAKSEVNAAESLYSSISYGDGDKRITIELKHWNWSDGKPITSRDFSFVYNMLRSDPTDWSDYTAGLFPVDVSKVTTPDAHTVVIDLTRSYNPNFYTDDVLSTIPLLPQHAWDRTSATGAVGDYDETSSGAKAVFSFLQKEGGDMNTFTTNPLWKVVDGPWRLSAFRGSTGYYSYAANTAYSGPDKPTLSSIVYTPFTTDTAELDQLRSGGSIDDGYLPLNDVKQASTLESEGYDIASQPIPGVAGIIPNFTNPKVGPIFDQLYVRQAMEDLIDRPQIVSKVFSGYADPGNGPVPVKAGGQWVSPLEKSGGPYPYSPSKAVALLRAHGWKVVPNGVSTCRRPGTAAADCGAGIAAGAQLSFQLSYASGEAAMDEENAAVQSSEAQAGIKLALRSEPFNTLIAATGICNAQSHPASSCGWQLVNFGYDPYNLYPAGEGIFNTDADGNQGGYSSAQMDQLINATEYGSGTSTFYSYEDYAARQLPWLWLPNEEGLTVYKKNLAGVAPLNPFSGNLNPEDWYFTSAS